MAYAIKYLFKFESSNGTTREIRVLQDGYTGEVIQRPLGRAPVLKKQQNGPVHGTSLEFYAECNVDREFIEFYTSDPKAYRVDLYAGATLLWQGYITPELYSEPDIAPPYDVQVVATDGVGELKLYDYAAQGTVTLRTLLSGLLSRTGLGTDIYLISSLKPGSAGAGSLLEKTINLDYMAGRTCYEVLTYILDTLHATITWWKGAWILTRETNVTFTNGKVRYFNTAGNSALLNDSVQVLGKMYTNPAWPVGQLSTVIDPAKNRVAVQAPWHVVTCLQNPDMGSDADWTKAKNARYETDGYVLPININTGTSETAVISQATSMAGLRVPMNLSVKATGATSEISAQVTGAVLGVLLTYKVDNVTYHLVKGDDGVPVWQQGGDIGTYIPLRTRIDFQQQLATWDSSRIEAEELTIDNIPPFLQGTTFPAGTLTVYILGYCAKIYGAYLDVVLPKGYQDILRIDNGARGEGNEVEIAIGRETTDNAYYAAFLQGLLLDSGNLITSFSDANFPGGMDYLAFIARDYALSVALPRAKVTGTVYLESGIAAPPLVFTKGALNYWLQTWSWNLYEDELEIEGLTLPSASLTVESETILESTASASSSSGRTSGGGAPISPGTSMAAVQEWVNSQGYLASVEAASTYATITALNGVSGRVTILEGRTNWDTYFGVDENGDIYVKKNGTTARNFYSWGAVSAGGLSSGGGASGVDLAAVWANLTANTGEGLNKVINVAHIPALASLSGNLTVSRISDIETWISGKGYLTEHQSLDGYVNDLTRTPASGGNYVSAVTKSGKIITVTYATLPTSLPASDVYSWAKAETKPSYAFSEITGTASTSQIPTLAISKISGLQTALDGKQPLDTDLTAIAGLTGTSGFLKKTAANTWALDTNTYLTTSSAASTYVSGVALNGNYLRVTKNGANTDLTIPYATQAQIPNWAIRTAFDPNAVEHAIESNYGESGSTKTNVPNEFLYGSVLTMSARGFNSVLSAQFLWDVRHGTSYPGWLWFRTKDSSSGWRDWTKVYTELSLTKSVLTDLLESSNGYYVKKSGDTMTGALTVSAQVIPVSMEFRNMSSSAGNGGYIDFHFNNSSADFTSRIIESASGILSILGGLSLGTTLQLGDGVLSWDGSANAWKLTGNFYATGFISAGGVSSGGGTAGVDLTAVWNNLVANTGEGLNKKINTAHIPDMASTYGYLKSAPVTSVAGNTGAVTAAQIATAIGLSGYLPLTGGTIKNGNAGTPLTLDTTSGTIGIYFATSATNKAWVGYQPTYGSVIYSQASSKYLGIKDDGTPHFQGNTLLHAANYTSYVNTTNFPGLNKVGTVTSVAMTVPTGLSVSGTPITTSGTLAISFASGYSIPTTAKQSNWDTAYGWGNHASAGYLLATTAASTYVSSVALNGNYLRVTKNGTNTDLTIPYATTASRLPRTNISAKSDLNTALSDGGLAYNYGSGSYWVNGPSGMSFGGVAEISQGQIALSAQFAWDIVHNVENGTKSLWYRAANNLGWCDWAEIYTSKSLTQSVVTGLIGTTTYAPYNANGYLPLTGGTIKNGNSTEPLYIDTTGTYVGAYFRVSGENKAWIGYFPSMGASIYNNASGKYLGIKDDGTPHFHGNTLWHSGNSNLSTVAWNASVFQAGGLSTYGASSIEFNTASGATNGGFIDFHYGGSTADFTSRFIEDASGRLSINNAIWVNWSGNVGVGTYLPTSKLQVSGQVLADAFATTNSYQASLNSTGWFKVFTAYNTNATSQTVILQIRRNFHYSNNETYTVAVNVAYNGKISFTQISGCANAQLIDKIRVEYVNSGSTIIALHYTGSVANTIFVSGIGDGVFCAPTAVSSVNGTAVEFSLQPNGVASNSNIVATGAITAGSASDARLKTNIQSLSAEAAKRIVMALNPVTFTWNDKATELFDQYKGDDLGMIAQEVEPYLPQAVGTIFENYKRLDYTKVISPLVKVAQDHETRIEKLEKEVKARDAKIMELESEIKRLRMN